MIMAMISAFASRGRLPLDGMGPTPTPLSRVGGKVDPDEIEGLVRLGLFDAGSGACVVTLMVGAGGGPLDEFLNEQPIFTPSNIGNYFREAMLP